MPPRALLFSSYSQADSLFPSIGLFPVATAWDRGNVRNAGLRTNGKGWGGSLLDREREKLDRLMNQSEMPGGNETTIWVGKGKGKRRSRRYSWGGARFSFSSFFSTSFQPLYPLGASWESSLPGTGTFFTLFSLFLYFFLALAFSRYVIRPWHVDGLVSQFCQRMQVTWQKRSLWEENWSSRKEKIKEIKNREGSLM